MADAREGRDLTLRLLWGGVERAARGPKPRLALADVVDAAIGLADEEGLEATSMRSVARRLGVGTMSLYRYVPSKEALVDLMFDTVLVRQARPDAFPGGWRAKLEAISRNDLAFYLRHPWVLDVSTSRPPLGPGTLDVYEAVLRVLDGTGLTVEEMNPTATALASYVRGAAHAELTRRQVERASGLTDEEWWAQRMDFWEDYFDPERYPTMTRIYQGGAYEACIDEFEFGLQRMLDGIEALIARRAGAS